MIGKFREKLLSDIAHAWALTKPYFLSEEKWKAWGMFLTIISLNLGLVYMAVLFNDWHKLFYNALQDKQASQFWTQLGRFAILAAIFIVIVVYKIYLTQILELRWRAWMTSYYLERWLSNHAFYKLELTRFALQANGEVKNPDNPDQRIQEDINKFTNLTVNLSMGLLNAVVTLVSFVTILWGLSGRFDFSIAGNDYNIPGFMVWMAVLYCATGSILTHFIGRPQIRLNFEQQRYEADFRNYMARVREYSESIALDKGEAVERIQMNNRFSLVLGNYLQLLKAQKNLVWFTTFFGQIAVVFPFMVAAPRFFSGAIQLGELTQISSAFGQVQGALSWFVDSYSDLASWRATTDRLTSFEASFEKLTQPHLVLSATDSPTLESHDLTVALPTGAVLLSGATLCANPGDSVLLQGPSGCGKSTMFRAFAGIWPYASGNLARPPDAMFIPQRPYFPNGPLRNALAYPEVPSKYDDPQLRQALVDALLPYLADQLDKDDAWSQKLSGGEQQRMAIARVLLKKPKWIFADEITSALDEHAETAVYKILQAHINAEKGAIISISHRPTVASLHKTKWKMEKLPEGGASLYKLEEHCSQDDDPS